MRKACAPLTSNDLPYGFFAGHAEKTAFRINVSYFLQQQQANTREVELGYARNNSVTSFRLAPFNEYG
jgi:hypothetical protein